jgi:hypothetical protein
MNKAEGDLENKFYSGERRIFSFERFAEIHQQAHTDLDKFGEPLTEAAKVRKFLKRITALSLELAIAAVCATTMLKNDFEAMGNYLSEFINKQNQAQVRNISSASTDHGVMVTAEVVAAEEVAVVVVAAVMVAAVVVVEKVNRLTTAPQAV